MLGIGWRLLLLALGGLAGYGLAYGLTLDDLAALLASEPAATELTTVEYAESTEVVVDDDCEPASPGTASAEPGITTGEHSRGDTGSELPRWASSQDPKTPAEWYRAYASELRDATLAGPAEDRIAELIAETATPGLRTEYLRCATRFCAIAGYVTSPSNFDSCSIGGWIGGAAVFRGSLRYSCIDQEYDGGRRFIVFVDSAPAS